MSVVKINEQILDKSIESTNKPPKPPLLIEKVIDEEIEEEEELFFDVFEAFDGIGIVLDDKLTFNFGDRLELGEFNENFEGSEVERMSLLSILNEHLDDTLGECGGDTKDEFEEKLALDELEYEGNFN